MTWRDRAACAGMDVRVFYTLQPAKAKAICARCPVRAECLAVAMFFERDALRRHGVWGGLTPGERERLAGGRKITVVNS